MDELTANTIREIEEKLGWAKRSVQKIKEDPENNIGLKDNFWSFLAAFQQAWFYTGKLIAKKHPQLSKSKKESLTKSIINDWKENNLTENEKDAWNILNQLRNSDVHDKPALPNYEIKTHFITTVGGKFILTTTSGKQLITRSINLSIFFEGKEYNIYLLMNGGISSVQKLLTFLPNCP